MTADIKRKQNQMNMITTVAKLHAYIASVVPDTPSVIMRSVWDSRWCFRVFWRDGGYNVDEYYPFGDTVEEIERGLAEMIVATNRPCVDVNALDVDIFRLAKLEATDASSDR